VSSIPPEAQLWPLVRGAIATQALRVAAQLRVADALATGPRPIDELAAEHDADAVYRVLRALATEGVFAEDEPGVFRNTPASELLRTDGEQRWHEFALQFGGEWYDAFALAPHAVRTAEPTFPIVFGAGFEEWMRDHPDAHGVFNRSMEAGAAERIERIAGLPWNAEVVVDVGGGTGRMLAELARRHPGVRGVLFELPEVAAQATVPEGCEVVAGSFLDFAPSGDAYVLSRILHGFADDPAERILRNVRAAASSGARVLILDSVVPPGNEPHGNKWLDLLMLVLSGGRERTEAEWRALLERAGLTAVRIEDGLIEATVPGH
jgi:SAM-dependent methyltransferase